MLQYQGQITLIYLAGSRRLLLLLPHFLSGEFCYLRLSVTLNVLRLEI